MTHKENIFNELISRLSLTYQSTLKEITSISEAAIDAPGRNESRYDTAKVELGNLASSMSQKAADMEATIKELSAFKLPGKSDTVIIGSLVEIFANGKKQKLLFLPVGGGQKIIFDNIEVMTVSKTAPLFSTLLNKVVGENITFNNRDLQVLNID